MVRKLFTSIRRIKDVKGKAANNKLFEAPGAMVRRLENAGVRRLMEAIVKDLRAPLFLPITDELATGRDLPSPVFDFNLTAMGYAMQLLKFAPANVKEWMKAGRVLGGEGDAPYQHRYPTPVPTVRVGELDVPVRKEPPFVGMYSAEDIARALTIIGYVDTRRKSTSGRKVHWIKHHKAAALVPPTKFPGYHNPDNKPITSSKDGEEQEPFLNRNASLSLVHRSMVLALGEKQDKTAKRPTGDNDDDNDDNNNNENNNEDDDDDDDVGDDDGNDTDGGDGPDERPKGTTGDFDPLGALFSSSSTLTDRLMRANGKGLPKAYNGPTEAEWVSTLRVLQHEAVDLGIVIAQRTSTMQRERRSFAAVLHSEHLESYMREVSTRPHYIAATRKSQAHATEAGKALDKMNSRLQALQLQGASADELQAQRNLQGQAFTQNFSVDEMYRTSFLLDAHIQSFQPPETVDFERLRRQMALTADHRLYDIVGVEPLLPHQVADLGRVIEKLKRGVSVGLNLDMGLGKTKIALATIEVMARRTESYNKSVKSGDEPQPHAPTLFILPVNVLKQTIKEASAHNPGFRLIVFYGSDKKSIGNTGAELLEAGRFHKVMKQLMDATHLPQTSRTVIFTSYDTWRVRMVRTTQTRFVFVKKDMDIEDDRKTPEADDDDDSDSELPDREENEEDRDEEEEEQEEDREEDNTEDRARASTPHAPHTPRKRKRHGDNAFASTPKKRRCGIRRTLTENELQQRMQDISEEMEKKKKKDASWKHATHYVKMELGHREIRAISKESGEDPDGNLINYEWRDESSASYSFKLLILDEAHIARNFQKSYNRYLSLIKREYGVWITGTLIMSGNRDIIGFACFLFEHVPIDGVQLADSLLAAIDRQSLTALWSSEYDPYSGRLPGNIDTGDGIAAKEKGRVVGILHDDFALDDNIKTVLRQYYDNGIRLWQVCPHLILAMGRIIGWEFTFSDSVTSALKNNFCIFRSARAIINSPDGHGVTFPGIDLPLQTVHYEEVNHGILHKKLVKTHGEESALSSFTPPSQGMDNVITTAVAGNRLQATGNVEKPPNRNFGSQRAGNMVAFDARFKRVLEHDLHKKMVKRKEAVARVLHEISHEGIKLTDAEIERIQKETNEGRVITFGTDSCRDLARSDLYHGLGTFFSMTNLEPGWYGPSTSSDWLQYLAHGSPVINRVIQLIYLYVIQGKERLLIFCDLPVLQMYLYGTVLLCGVQAFTARSTDKGSEKQAALDAFLNPKTGPCVFVANMSIMGTGVNLQRQCCKGIFVNFHSNAQIIRQAQARLYRMGQLRHVVWHVIKVVDSYQDYVEHGMLKRWTIQLWADVKVPS